MSLALTTARADFILLQKVEGKGVTGEMTVKFKGTKVRTDLAGQMSTIADSATGQTIVLQHKTRTFNRISAEQTKDLSEQVLKAQEADEPPVLTPTGEKKEIAGHQTQGYLWTVGKMKVKFWVCTDFPGADALQQQLNILQSSGLGTAAASLMPSAVQLPGLRLRTEIEVGPQKVATTIVAIKQTAVPPDVFEIPATYKEVLVPIPSAEM
jgi:hypothetical protein